MLGAVIANPCLADIWAETKTIEATVEARSLVQKVAVTPTKTGADVEVFSAVELLVEQRRTCRAQITTSWGNLVAEEGLEPPTRGL